MKVGDEVEAIILRQGREKNIATKKLKICGYLQAK